MTTKVMITINREDLGMFDGPIDLLEHVKEENIFFNVMNNAGRQFIEETFGVKDRFVSHTYDSILEKRKKVGKRDPNNLIVSFCQHSGKVSLSSTSINIYICNRWVQLFPRETQSPYAEKEKGYYEVIQE